MRRPIWKGPASTIPPRRSSFAKACGKSAPTRSIGATAPDCNPANTPVSNLRFTTASLRCARSSACPSRRHRSSLRRPWSPYPRRSLRAQRRASCCTSSPASPARRSSSGSPTASSIESPRTRVPGRPSSTAARGGCARATITAASARTSAPAAMTAWARSTAE